MRVKGGSTILAVLPQQVGATVVTAAEVS